MTIHEMYDQTIKPLLPGERLRLARLILDDLSPDDPPNTIRDQAHLEELLLAGINSGPTVRVTDEFWTAREQAASKRLGSE